MKFSFMKSLHLTVVAPNPQSGGCEKRRRTFVRSFAPLSLSFKENLCDKDLVGWVRNTALRHGIVY